MGRSDTPLDGAPRESSPRMGRPTAKPGEKPTAERILGAAIDLFAENGFESTSVKSVALSLGLTEGAVYRHYKNKDALLEAIFDFADRFVFSPLPAETDIGKKAGVSIFRGLLSPLPSLIAGEGSIVKIMRIMFIEMHRDERIRKRYEAEYVDRADELLESLFEKCMAAGEIVPCDARSLAKVFNSVRSEWAYRNFVVRRSDPPDADALGRELEETIVFFERHFSARGYHTST